MELSKRNFLLLLLSAPSCPALSCTGPFEAFEGYRNKKLPGKLVCDTDGSCTFEEFMTKKFGRDKWEYDEKFFIQYPENPESPSVVPVTTGAIDDALAQPFAELTIYIESSIAVAEPGVRNYERTYTEEHVSEVVRFRFFENTPIYISTRLNLSALAKARPYGGRMFSVISNGKGLVKVAKPAYPINAVYCGTWYYAK